LAVAVLSSAALAGGFFGGAFLLDKVDFARAESQVELSRQQLSHVEDLSTVFREVDKVVEPSVVMLEVTRSVHMAHPDIDQNLLRRFFNDNGQDAPPDATPDAPNEQQQDFEQQDTGSGVIMETDDGYGYIITNNHVAGGASDITVTLSDGRVIKHAHLMGADPLTDLAVVRVKSNDLIAAKWGNSDELQKGDWVLAFGSPLGYSGTMTHGIVSALNRNDVGVIDHGYEHFIQVDAPINPGNSGGPLVNIHGEVVGINAAIASKTGLFSGIGFAIPSNQAHTVYDTLKGGHKVVRGWLGVDIANVSDEQYARVVKNRFGYNDSTGVFVRGPIRGTPSWGKLIGGDIITAYNGTPIKDTEQLQSLVASTAPDTVAKLTVFRDGKSTEVDITLGSRPDDVSTLQTGEQGAEPQLNQQQQQDAHVASEIGVTLQSLTPGIARQLNIDPGTTGAVVTKVSPGSIADKAGLHPGIIITQVGRTAVNSARQANDALSKVDVKKGVALRVLTSDGPDFVYLQADDDTPSNN
jgi:serine protease Do